MSIIQEELDELTQNASTIATAKTNIANAITAKGGTVSPGDGLLDFANDIANIPIPTPSLTTKSINTNGTYNASSDNVDGYSSVSVNVPAPTLTGFNNYDYHGDGYAHRYLVGYRNSTPTYIEVFLDSMPSNATLLGTIQLFREPE